MASAVPYVAGHGVGHERITIEHVMLSLSFDEEIEARSTRKASTLTVCDTASAKSSLVSLAFRI